MIKADQKFIKFNQGLAHSKPALTELLGFPIILSMYSKPSINSFLC